MAVEQHPSIDNQFLEQIHQIIEENLGKENFTVEDLAHSAGLSRSTLHRRLKKLTGKSASDLITLQRINHAMKLLQNNAGTASEIAYRVGFSDPSYFNKVFRKHFKISPGKVRSSHIHHIASAQTENEILLPKYPSPVRNISPGKIVWASLILLLLIIGLTIITLHLRPGSETSIAVLPLLNLTGVAGNDYFVDGLHDALVSELGQINTFRVISTTSSRHFRNSKALLPDIADQLGVNTIVEGSVTAIDDSLKVIIQLIDVYPRERHLFVAEYHDVIQNVLAITKNAAQDIARHTNTRLRNIEGSIPDMPDIVDPITYMCYVRGMFYINQGTEESIQRGIDTLASAIRKDPGDPNALAGYALGKAIQGHGSNIANAYFRSATVSAKRAITIDKNNAVAHTALALLNLYQYWDWDEAREAFEKALSINPNNDVAQAHFAWYHVLFGNNDAAIYHAHQAVIIDPLSATYKSWLAWLHFINKNYDQAEYWARESLKMNNQIPWGNLVLGWTQLEKGNFQKALEAHEKLPTQAIHWRWFLCRTYVLTGNRDKAMRIWDDLSKESEFWINPFYKGMIAGVLGYPDQAFSLLKEACENKYYPAEYLIINPSTEFIREDPRFDKLLMMMDLPVQRLKIAEETE